MSWPITQTSLEDGQTSLRFGQTSLSTLSKGGGWWRSLFAHGENGFFFGPADQSYLTTDTAGATPVAADGDAIARFRDRSGKNNHAVQATAANRPLWKVAATGSYSQSDGVSDGLVSPFLPTAALTLAVAFNCSVAGALIGGGNGGTGNRCRISLDAGGKLAGGWGAQSETNIVVPNGADLRNADHVGIFVADATSVDLWVDGVKLYSQPPNGTGFGGSGGLTLHASNNGGTLGQFSNSRIYAGLGLSRRVTSAEVALITDRFQGSFSLNMTDFVSDFGSDFA